jgi:hypothetical protein
LFVLEITVEKHEGRRPRFPHVIDVLDDSRAGRHDKFSGGQKYGEVHIPKDALSCARYEREKDVSLSEGG